jgi:hypothetical protein
LVMGGFRRLIHASLRNHQQGERGHPCQKV